MPHTIEIDHVTKIFRPARGIARWLNASPVSREVKALQEVSLTLQKGEVFGLLGPNGAGKTTLLKILSTLILPSSGKASVLGYDLLQKEEEVRKRIGLVYSDERSFYWRLSGRENLRFYGTLMDLSGKVLEDRVAELSRLFKMEHFLDNRYDAYSAGMKQRLSLARGFFRSPQVLLMDEPTRGLDPASSEDLLHQVRTVARDMGTTVFMVTHSLQEAERFCDRIGILNQGRMVCEGRIEELRRTFRPPSRYRLVVPERNEWVLDQVRHHKGITDLQWSACDNVLKIDVEILEADKNLSRILGFFQEKGVPILHVESGSSELKSIFTSAVQKEAG